MRRSATALAVLLGTASACGGDTEAARPVPTASNPAPRPAPPDTTAEPEPAPAPEAFDAPATWTDDWILSQAERYLDDAAFRRRILEASLTNPTNVYSAVRMSAYARADMGWDALPVWIPRAAPVTNETARALQTGAAWGLPADTEPLWDGTRPTTMDEWVALGRRVFFAYPLRPEVFAEHALAHPSVAEEIGVGPVADGTWPGFVAFVDLDQRTRVGITCALCHVAVEDGAMVIGRAHRRLDYGQMRLAYHRDTGIEIDADLAVRMASWGPGRADITQDDDEDPVAIPDLWRVREQTHLTQAGTLRHVHPAALAIRQETQILHANRERTRPPRELAWALAMYVYSLTPPPREEPAPSALTQTGAALFDTHCRNCHAEPNGTGVPIDAALVGTEPSLANGGARGTGKYRPAPLVRIADAAPYLHHGVVPTLEALLGPQRLSPDYTGGVRGPGPIEGHRFGTALPQPDRDALLAYLRTL